MNNFLKAIIFGSFLFVASCAKEPEQGPKGDTGPAGPSFIGAIKGKVELYNQHGALILSNLQGIEVKVEETGKTVTTDAEGKYTIDSVMTGNYTITYSDPANLYGVAKATTVQYVSGELYLNARLSQIPTFTLASCNAGNITLNGGSYVRLVTVASAASSQPRSVAVYVGTSSNVSSALNNHLQVYSADIRPGQTSDTLFIPAQNFYAAGFNPGNTAYLRIYPAAVEFQSTSNYLDKPTGRIVYNAISSSGVNASVNLP